MKRSLCLLLTLNVLFTIATRAQVITTFAGNGTAAFGGDGGAATAAGLVQPWGVAVTTAGSKYISDFANNRIRKINATGAISTIAGNGTGGYSGDGGAAISAKVNSPRGIATDPGGNLYIADQNNHVIRKITNSGIISTVVGTGTAGYSGDGGSALSAKLSYPQAVAIDRFGNLYIVDLNQVVRKVNASGIISTIAGTPGFTGYSGDGGPALTALFNNPYGICVDTSGNIFVADNGNNVIRKITSAGIISTYAGNDTAGYSGDGHAATAAELNGPVGIALDSNKNLFIADELNNVIRKVTPTGTISTFAGNGTAGYSGDGGIAVLAKMKMPTGVTCDGPGNVYAADQGNAVVRKVNIANRAPAFTRGASYTITMCEDATAYGIDSLLAIRDSNLQQTETWNHVYGPHHGTVAGAYGALSTDSIVTPSGFTYTAAAGYNGRDTLKIRVNDGSLSDTIAIYVLVNPTPPLSVISGHLYGCIGRRDTLTDTASAGVWSAVNSTATISSTGVVTGITTGVDTIIYTKVLAGCINSIRKVITVYPTSTSITGVNITCIAHSVTLDATPAGGVWNSLDTIATVNAIGSVSALKPGFDTITYTITNSCGSFTAEHAFTINDIVIPYVLITATPSPDIRPGQTDTLTVSLPGSTGLFTYQWQKNGIDIPGATGMQYINNDFANNDSITCLAYNIPCTYSAFGWIYLVVGTLDIVNTGMQNASVRLFPNPNNGSFSIKGNVSDLNKEATIEVTNMVGQVVYKEVATIQNGTLDQQVNISNTLPDGMYLLRLITNERNTVIRFSVEGK